MDIKSMINLFTKGHEVANPVLLKSVQVKTNNIATVLIAVSSIAAMYGYDFNISEELAQNLAMGIGAFLTISNSVLTVITSKKAGL